MTFRTIPALLLLLLAASAAQAQHVGIAGRYGISLLEDGRLTDAWRAWCGCEESGSALAQQVLFSATFLYGDDGAPIAAGARLGYGAGTTRFVSPDYSSFGPDLPPDATLQYTEVMRYSTLRVDLEGRWNAGGGLALTLGPWFEYLLQSDTDRSERIISPGGPGFPGGSQERTLGSSSIAPQDLRWGMSLGVSASVPIARGVHLVPYAVLDADIEGLGRARPGALSLGVGTAVVFDLRQPGREPGPIVVIDDTVAAAASAREADRAPRATLELYAIDGSERVTTAHARRVTEYRRMVVQMPATLRFDAETEMETRGMTRFTMESLVGAEPIVIRRSALDVLGLRLIRNPKSRVRLIGESRSGEPRGAGRERAVRVRDVLSTAWGIDPRRIAVSSAPMRDGRREPLVRIESASSTLLEPIVVEWIDERFALPSLGVAPSIDAPDGVRSAHLRLTRNGRLLVEGSIDDEAALRDLAIDLRDAGGSTVAPIIAELEVADSSGAVVRARDELPLALPHKSTGDTYDNATLVLAFDDDSRLDEAMFDELRDALRSAVRVTVRVSDSTAGRVVEVIRAMVAKSGAAVGERVSESGGIVVEIDGRSR